MSDFELIISIVNKGFTSVVMDAARAVGAKGGTIVTARGSGAHEAEKMFGLTVQPEKELVFIVTAKESRNAIMQSIISKAGLNTLGMGICFSLPVDDVMGVALGINNPTADETTQPSADRQTASADNADDGTSTADIATDTHVEKSNE